MNKFIVTFALLSVLPFTGNAMHITEGFLPPQWSVFWAVVFVPFFILGLRSIKKRINDNSANKLLIAVMGAFVFVLSSLKLPSVAGSSSHLTGIALGALLIGSSSMSVLGIIVLIFQSVLLAHGGITTLGANAFSMAVVGSFTAIAIFKGTSVFFKNKNIAVFLAAFFSDISVYICTSFQLAMAFQSESAPLYSNFMKFISVFAVTQLPLAIIEGLLTVLALKLILSVSKNDDFISSNKFMKALTKS